MKLSPESHRTASVSNAMPEYYLIARVAIQLSESQEERSSLGTRGGDRVGDDDAK